MIKNRYYRMINDLFEESLRKKRHEGMDIFIVRFSGQLGGYMSTLPYFRSSLFFRN